MSTWPPGPAQPKLASAEIHVWRLSLDQPSRPLRSLLSADEQARADRFRFTRDRRRFITGRGLLRTILGYYLERPPAILTFTYDPWGKPSLPDTGLTFNLTHAHQLALVAVAWERAVGIDLEYRLDPPADVEVLAERFFATEEAAALRNVPETVRSDTFLQGWTRKEAYLKARGDGLSHPLDRFAVSIGPGVPATLLWDAEDPQAPEQWRLLHLDPHPAYVATLAAAGQAWQVRCWSY